VGAPVHRPYPPPPSPTHVRTFSGGPLTPRTLDSEAMGREVADFTPMPVNAFALLGARLGSLLAKHIPYLFFVRALERYLSEFVRKSCWDFRNEPAGPEVNANPMVLNLLVGIEGLYQAYKKEVLEETTTNV